MARNDMVDVFADLMDETEKAWKFAVNGEENNTVWVPKSIGEWKADHDDEVTGTVSVPEWFAEKEGMV